MKKIAENIETPIKYECDVLVAGGGVAGISAALAAARAGADVMLLERSYMLGGLATAGLVTIYLPLCDGEGEQVSFGIAEELLLLSNKHGAEGKYSIPECWQKEATREERKNARYKTSFNPWLFAIDAERLLMENGVKLLYGAAAVSSEVVDGRIEHIIIEGKSGREAVKIKKCVVDTTGDADICKMSGAPTAEFAPKNKLAAWYYFESEGNVSLSMLGVCDDMTVKTRDLSGKRYRALETSELSDMMIDSHASTYNDIMRRKERGEQVSPTAIATIPQVRMTRRIAGEYTLDDSEIRSRFEDSIGMVSDWRKCGPVYEIPFRTLYSGGVKNLLAAGRCISVTDDMWDITRVIPVCAVTGEAAGTAAAMTDSLDTLSVSELQAKLTAAGVKLHL